MMASQGIRSFDREGLITIGEMAGWFGVSISEAEAIIVQGDILCTRDGRDVLICEKSLNDWIERQFNFQVDTYRT